MSQWSGNGLITYYLSLILNSIGITASFDKTLINGILQIFNFASALLGALLVDRMGRRPLWLWSIAGMLVSYIVWTTCSAVYDTTASRASAIAVLVLIFVYQFHYAVAITPFSFSKGYFISLSFSHLLIHMNRLPRRDLALSKPSKGYGHLLRL